MTRRKIHRTCGMPSRTRSCSLWVISAHHTCIAVTKIFQMQSVIISTLRTCLSTPSGSAVYSSARSLSSTCSSRLCPRHSITILITSTRMANARNSSLSQSTPPTSTGCVVFSAATAAGSQTEILAGRLSRPNTYSSWRLESMVKARVRSKRAKTHRRHVSFERPSTKSSRRSTTS